MLADLLHRVRRGIWRVIAGPYSTRNVSVDRCMDCGKRLTADERGHYEVNCERCEGIAFHEQQESVPPICADTGAPKWPGNCWNVRCQLGGTCCRADGVEGRKP